jgi:hypothetical protein
MRQLFSAAAKAMGMGKGFLNCTVVFIPTAQAIFYMSGATFLT